MGEEVEDYGVGGEVGYYWWHGSECVKVGR